MKSDGSGLTYRDVGVDLDAAAALKRRIGELVTSTRTPEVRAAFGSFGGRFAAPEGSELVASVDGVGTKLEVASRTERHDTVGEDLVNHCVNDVLAEGAMPLVFMDYFACGRLEAGVALAVVRGIARGCRRNGCALLGGETAEMPGFYAPGQYDLAGFVVGRVAFPEVSQRSLRAGDRLVALASSGLHTNGYTLARRLLFERLRLKPEDEFPGTGSSVAEVLLRVHRSYLPILQELCAAGTIQALAHITGGGLVGNLDRVLPAGLDARIDLGSWCPPAEFRTLAEASGAPATELYRTFNMGVGMVAVVRSAQAAAVTASIRSADCEAWICGSLAPGEGKVHLEGLEP